MGVWYILWEKSFERLASIFQIGTPFFFYFPQVYRSFIIISLEFACVERPRRLLVQLYQNRYEQIYRNCRSKHRKIWEQKSLVRFFSESRNMQGSMVVWASSVVQFEKKMLLRSWERWHWNAQIVLNITLACFSCLWPQKEDDQFLFERLSP